MICDRCKTPADRLILGWCDLCAYPNGDGPVQIERPVRKPVGPPCDTCGQELFLVRPGRTTCARCRPYWKAKGANDGQPVINADHPDTPRDVSAALMLETHPPLDEPGLCQVQGACGAPLTACPIHQQGVTCLLEMEGWSGYTPGSVDRIASVEEARRRLELLRWDWNNSCGEERPEIEAQARRVQDRIRELQAPPVNRALRLLEDLGVVP